MDAFTSSGDKLYDDVRRRLSGSILFYKGVPVVCSYYETTKVTVVPLERYITSRFDTPVPIEYTDPDLVDTIPTLGYVNLGSLPACVVTRTTVRSQRAGLPTEQILMDGSPGSSSYIYNSGFRDMLLNSYPIMEDAYTLSKTCKLAAFSKSYAIDNKKNIFHRGHIIGTLVPSDKYLAGYDIRYHHTISRISFYRKNFGDRYEKQLQRFKES